MHELGIVMHLIGQVEKVAEENGAAAVRRIVFEVGEVSTVVPDLFLDAFEWAKKKTKYLKEATLDIIVLEGITFCRDCEKTFNTTEYGKECPYCGSFNTYLVTGDELKIKELEVE